MVAAMVALAVWHDTRTMPPAVSSLPLVFSLHILIYPSPSSLRCALYLFSSLVWLLCFLSFPGRIDDTLHDIEALTMQLTRFVSGHEVDAELEVRGTATTTVMVNVCGSSGCCSFPVAVSASRTCQRVWR